MPTNTTNLNLKKPIVGADEDLWGGYINDNLDDLDSLLGGASPLALSSANNWVGIGTSSIDYTAAGRTVVHVEGSAGALLALEDTGAKSYLFQSGDDLLVENDTASGNMIFGTNSSTERMRIESSGNLLVGAPYAQNRITIGSGTNDDGLAIWNTSTASTPDKRPVLNFFATDTVGTVKSTGRISAVNYDGNCVNSALAFFTRGADSNTEKMRLDPSGNLLVGTTVSGGVGGLTIKKTTLTSNCVFNRPYTTANSFPIEFRNNTALIGYIQYNSNAVSYVTSSDYRLKEDVQSMTGASDRVMALNPVNFAWKADGTRVDGFLAHELQEVVPEAATGTKDAMTTEEYEVTPAVYEDVVIPAVMDDEGNEVQPERTEQRLVSEAVMGTREVPDYQGIDQSKLVPLLTAALQEALTEIADLKTRVAALETA